MLPLPACYPTPANTLHSQPQPPLPYAPHANRACLRCAATIPTHTYLLPHACRYHAPAAVTYHDLADAVYPLKPLPTAGDLFAARYQTDWFILPLPTTPVRLPLLTVGWLL